MLTVLGLGTNIGNRLDYLTQAVRQLSENVLHAIEVSPIYESRAVLPEGAPQSWDTPFLNMAVRGETDLSPQTLLQQVKYIEHKLGRQPRGEWGPREIDIDILVYEELSVNTGDLIIPHKHLCNREFALIPLADVAPNWRFPENTPYQGKTAFEVASHLVNIRQMVKTPLFIERRKEILPA